MTSFRLGFAFAPLATTLLVACGSSETEPARTPSPDAGAGGGGTSGSGGSTAAEAGGTPASGGRSGSPLEGGACLPDLARCDDGTPCCPGAVCAPPPEQGGAGDLRCRRTCSERTDCGSLCCLDDATTGKKLCADASLCPAIECSAKGGPCTAVSERCCSGLVCVAWTNPPRSGCEQACTLGTECASGCCLPLPGAKASSCAAAEACQCAALDAKCGGSSRCCDGLECTTFDASGAFACKPRCQGNGDCATQCCVPLTGANTSVCLGKEWCAK